MSNFQKDEVHRFSEAFKALSNPNRLHIFLRLISCCPPGTKCITDAAGQCVGDLGRDLEIDPSTVSHHLKELRRSGLIRMERRGKRIICWVDREMVLGLTNLLTGYPLLTLTEEMSGLMQGNAPKSSISEKNT
jgi:ArsR family transcriptional regulator, arsenate/arsenite/antimonite-responsive transcriptional repressor